MAFSERDWADWARQNLSFRLLGLSTLFATWSPFKTSHLIRPIRCEVLDYLRSNCVDRLLWQSVPILKPPSPSSSYQAVRPILSDLGFCREDRPHMHIRRINYTSLRL